MTQNKLGAFGGGAVIGALGGLIGLGGAEFRLPLLIGVFGFQALEAVILNKAMSLVVVATALPFRAAAIPFSDVFSHSPVIVNLLAGSLLGAWVGAGWATRLKSETLYRVIAILLVAIAIILILGHQPGGDGHPALAGPAQIIAGITAGFVIGIVASLLGVAGGDLRPSHEEVNVRLVLDLDHRHRVAKLGKSWVSPSGVNQIVRRGAAPRRLV